MSDAVSRPGPRPGPRWTRLALKLAIVLVIAWGVRHTLVDGARQLFDHQRAGSLGLRFDYAWLTLASGLYLLGLLPAGLFWRRLLTRLGQDAGAYETLRAYYIGHLGKYVPGKALVVILRAGLIRGDRVSTRAAAATVFYETLTFMAVGASLAGLVLAVGFREHAGLAALGFALALLAGVPVLPPVFVALARKAGVGRGHAAETAALESLNYRVLAWGWLSIAAGWIAIGASLAAVLRGIGAEQEAILAALPLHVAATALALVAGFLSLLPGGALVREMVLMQLLAPQFLENGASWALVSALILRLVWLLSEVAISAILYVLPGPTATRPDAA